jgi:Rps23 Pro-64 3,4-dihydroxylase Tpa1-like proline 4-hydroxylase
MRLAITRVVSVANAQPPARRGVCALFCTELQANRIRSKSSASPSKSCGVLLPSISSSAPAIACSLFGTPHVTGILHKHAMLSLRDRCIQARCLSSDIPEPTINAQLIQDAIAERAPEMSQQLTTNGYFTCTNFVPKPIVELLRSQSVELRNKGRYETSWSEKVRDDGTVERFDKEGVYACEPDGKDYYDAPDLITYMSVLLQTLPSALNGQSPTSELDLSNASFNAKLAVTSPGGSKYPLHIDNPQGLSIGDTRKLTCILYLNPQYKEGDGGELRMFVKGKDTVTEGALETVDLTPEGGRILMFFSDEIPHEVLATAPNGAKDDASLDRYALTVWIPTKNVAALHNQSSKFCDLKELAFP